VKRNVQRESSLQFQPLTPERWKDLEVLFGERGAVVIEGYPVDPRKGTMPDAFAWTGLVSAFRRAGFDEMARRSATRPIMRLKVRCQTR